MTIHKGEGKSKFTVRDIEDAVCRRYSLSKTAIRSHDRKRAVARPRQVIMFLSRELTMASYPQIGRHLGGRDHTTILYGNRKIAQLLRETNTMACEVEGVREILRQIIPYRHRVAAAVGGSFAGRLAPPTILPETTAGTLG